MRRFKLKKKTQAGGARGAEWLNRETVYEGELVSMTARIVRLFAPDPGDPRPHVDLPYDWVIPVR